MDKWSETLRQKLQVFLTEFHAVCERSGRKKNVKILFATKYIIKEQFVAFIDICRNFDIKDIIIGENRVNEWEEKYEWLKLQRPELVGSFKRVMIGTLQKNKIIKALSLFEEIHSLDSMELAQAIDSRVEKGRKVPIYLEVNVSGEESKHGFAPEELEFSLSQLSLLKSLKVEGLMTMAPHTHDENVIRQVFRTLCKLAHQYNLKTSMGMSHDWKIAVKEGSDMVRIGSTIFRVP